MQPHSTTTELAELAQSLHTWAQASVGAVGLQIWVADDTGLHPRAVIGLPTDAVARQCARQACLQNSAVFAGSCLAVPLALSDPCSGACVFVLPGDAGALATQPVQAKIQELNARVDAAVQSERLARLSGLARKSDLLRTTLTLAHALEHCAHLGHAMAELHGSLKNLMYAENFFICVLDEARENLVFEYIVDLFDEDVLGAIPFREGRLQGSLSAIVVSAGRVLRGSSRELLERAGHVDTLEDFGYGPNSADWLGVPMVVANETLGAVVVQSYDPAIRFADSDPSMLSMVAEAIAAALHRRRVRAALERTVAERTAQLEQSNSALLETVSKLERAMKQLVQAEKLASLGTMVAGISHELNTPIGVALTVTTSLEERFESMTALAADGKLTRKGLDEFFTLGLDMTRLVVRSTTRAAGLVTSFKQVAVDQTSENRRHFELHQVVDDLLTAMGTAQNRPEIVITNAVPAGLSCDSYPGPLAQVIANLVQNALAHGFQDAVSGCIRLDAAVHQERITLTVSDNGIGMGPHIQARAFDPFFTTKLGQGGSGLGLAVCHRIVTSVLGGDLTIESTPGQGASLVLEIPLIAPGRL